MSTQVATFGELLRKSIPITKKRIWTFVLGLLLLFATWIVPQVLSSVFFSLMKLPSMGQVKIVFWIVGFILSVLAIVIQMLPGIYTLLIIVDQKSGVIASFKKSWTFVVRYFLASIWIFLRSYTWIALIGVAVVAVSSLFKGQAMELPFITLGGLLVFGGIIAGLLFFPRFAFSLVILVKENCSAWTCVSESYKRTRGYWGKIVGNAFLYSLTCLGVSLVIALVFGILGIVSVVLQSSGFQLLSTLVMIPTAIVGVLAFISLIAFLSLLGRVFTVELYETIHAHPIHCKVKKA